MFFWNQSICGVIKLFDQPIVNKLIEILIKKISQIGTIHKKYRSRKIISKL